MFFIRFNSVQWILFIAYPTDVLCYVLSPTFWFCRFSWTCPNRITSCILLLACRSITWQYPVPKAFAVNYSQSWESRQLNLFLKSIVDEKKSDLDSISQQQFDISHTTHLIELYTPSCCLSGRFPRNGRPQNVIDHVN